MIWRSSLVFGWVVFLFGCAEPPPPQLERKNFLLITLDTVRADFLEPYGFPQPSSPNLQSFAKDALLFERAYATAPRTGPSHASIMTSRYTSSHGVLFNGVDLAAAINEESVTLAEHLRNAGFVTGGVVSVSALDQRFGFDRGFDDFEHERTRRKIQQPDAGGGAYNVTRTAAAWLRRNRDERFFLWAHYYEAHLPFHPEPESCAALGIDPCELVTFDSAMAHKHTDEAIRQSYAAEVHELDRYVGELLATLAALGLDRNTVVAIVADHGEYLGEHQQFGHQQLYDEMLHVPMMIRTPIGETGRRSEMVSTMDLAPTVLNMLDVPPLPGAQGIDLGGNRIQGSRVVFAEWRDHQPFLGHRQPNPGDLLISGQSDEGKIILDLLFPEQSEAFDLTADPAESHNLFGGGTPMPAELENALKEYLRAMPPGSRNITSLNFDEETRRRLRALGYL